MNFTPFNSFNPNLLKTYSLDNTLLSLKFTSKNNVPNTPLMLSVFDLNLDNMQRIDFTEINLDSLTQIPNIIADLIDETPVQEIIIKKLDLSLIKFSK